MIQEYRINLVSIVDFYSLDTPHAEKILKYLRYQIIRGEKKWYKLSKKRYKLCKSLLSKCNGKSESQIDQIFKPEIQKIEKTREELKKIIEESKNEKKETSEISEIIKAIKEEEERVVKSIENPVNHGEITTSENEEDILHQ